MRAVLIDTSAYSGFMRGHPGLNGAFQNADEIYLNPIVLGELLSGFMRGSRRVKNEEELREFLSSSRVQIVPLDESTSERYAAIFHALRKAGTPVPTNDLWIAASAMQHGLRILTMDAHYRKMPQILVEYYH